jgi:nucleotide-binding universal stress UspA family protein
MTTDGTQTVKPDTSARDTSAQVEETSKKETTTYTKADVQKEVSDALAAAGRTAKQLKDQQDAIARQAKEIADAQANWKRQQDERELELVKDDPDAMNAVKLRQKARDDAERAQRDREEATRLRQEAIADKINAIAEKNGVNANDLIELSHGDPDTAKRLVAYLPKATASQTVTETKKETDPVLNLDPGVTIGGSNKIGNLPPKDRVREAEKRLK